MTTLEYDIRVIGRRALEAEFASIERRLSAHNAAVTRLTGMNSSRAARSASTGSSVAADARAATAAQRQQAREAAAAARAHAQAQIAAKRQAARESSALARQQARQDDYWAKARVASLRQQHREELQLARRSELERRRAHRASLLENRREERRALVASRREARERSSFIQSTLGGTAGRVSGAVSSVGRMGLMVAGIGGTALAAGAISQSSRLDEGARRLAVMGRDPGQSGVNPDDLRRKFTQVGIATGIRPEDVMAGAAAYTAETGDMTGAISNLQTFATVAQGAGASIEDIARAAAHMRKIGVTSVDDMKQALATLTMQGKKGSYEIRDMAAEFPEVMSAAAKMGITGVAGLTQLGGFMQVAKKATGNASETTTATSQFFNQLVAKSDDLASGEALGGKVDVFADKGKTKFRDFRDLIGEVLVASGGNIEKINDVFEIRGSKAFNPFTSTFNQTREAALKRGASDKAANEEARKAATAILDDASNVPGGWNDVQADAADAMRSFSVQMGVVSDQMKDAVSSELFAVLRQVGPDLGKLVMPVRTLTRVLVEAARLLANNPFAGLGALVAVSLAAEITKARIGGAIRSAIDRVAGAGGAPIPGVPDSPQPAGGTYRTPRPRGVPSTMDALGALTTGAAIGITIGTAILTAGIVNFQAEEARMNTGGARVRAAESGDPLQQDPEQLRKDLNDQRNDTERAKRGVQGRKTVEEGTGLASVLSLSGFALIDEMLGTGIRETLADGIGTALGLGSKTELNTSQGYEGRIEKRLNGVEQLQEFAARLEKAGTSQESAAKQLAAAAEKLGLAASKGDVPSRTAAPSSPKI